MKAGSQREGGSEAVGTRPLTSEQEADMIERRSAGTLKTRRTRLPWPSGRPFRILSIDGGGIRGVLPASVLAEIESRLLNGASAGAYFDLICGTSTGGIIALGLATGISAARLAHLYREHGEAIFPPLRGR